MVGQRGVIKIFSDGKKGLSIIFFEAKKGGRAIAWRKDRTPAHLSAVNPKNFKVKYMGEVIRYDEETGAMIIRTEKCDFKLWRVKDASEK